MDPSHIKSNDSLLFLKSKSKCDVFGLAETYVQWKKLNGTASLFSWVKQRWRYFKISTSHNHHANLGKTQMGGTCVVIIGQAVYIVVSVGENEKKLGR